MIQIQPVVFPLNLGTADKISINISANANEQGAKIRYILFDNSSSKIKFLSSGILELSEEQFLNHGNDKDWITNYTVQQLGIVIVS